MKSAVALVLALNSMALHVPPASAQPEVRQRAVEEIFPGVFVRGGAAVVINVDPRCDPRCADGETCARICNESPCDSDTDPSAHCTTCDWECVP